jgi:hypothetical protein
VRAVRRITDPGLADRVLAAEGQAITAEADRRAQQVVRPWRPRPYRDVFGYLRCGVCGGVLEAPSAHISEALCSCPIEMPVPLPDTA